MSFLFGKRVDEACSNGQGTSHFEAESIKLTQHTTWTIWLNTVKEFFKQGRSTKPEIASSFVFINEDPRPYVTIKVRSRNLTALLDTGASISVIGQKGMIILDT